MYYCKHMKKKHLCSLLNEVQQLVAYEFFSIFEHLVFHLVHMTAARRTRGKSGLPQAFSDKQDAPSPRRQLTMGKERGKRKRSLRPLPPSPGRGPAHHNRAFTLQKITSFVINKAVEESPCRCFPFYWSLHLPPAAILPGPERAPLCVQGNASHNTATPELGRACDIRPANRF